MGKKSKRLLAFGTAQADAVNKALAAGDAETAVRAATITPWRPLFGQEQAASLLQGAVQQQVAKKLEVITQTPASVTQPFIQTYAQKLQASGPIAQAQDATKALIFTQPAAAPATPPSPQLQAVQQQIQNLQPGRYGYPGYGPPTYSAVGMEPYIAGQAVGQDPTVYPSTGGTPVGSSQGFEDGNTSFAPDTGGAGGYGPAAQYEPVPATSEVYSSDEGSDSGIVDDTAGSSMAYDEGYSRGRGVDEAAYGSSYESGDESGYGFATDAGEFDSEVYGGELEMGNLLGLSELGELGGMFDGVGSGITGAAANVKLESAKGVEAAKASTKADWIKVLSSAIEAGGQVGTAVLQSETQKQIAKQQAKADQQQGYFGPVSGGSDLVGTVLKLGAGAGLLYVGYRVISKILAG